MKALVQNKHEFLFLYDVQNSNPNGDPSDENKPRFDADRRVALVSDVRLKRTVRDYLFSSLGHNTSDKDIFVRTTFSNSDKKKSDSNIKDGKERAKDFGNDAEKIVNTCIDIRLFGAVIPLDKKSIKYTGPVQFDGMGKSLNQTEIVTIEGTGAFASSSGKDQATFRTEYNLPYALIGFNGVLCNQNANVVSTREDDLNDLKTAMWEGTKNLNTRSKFGQMPQLLLDIEYSNSFHIGRLKEKVKLVPNSNMTENKVRTTDDYVLDVTKLIDTLRDVKDKIVKINIVVNKDLKVVYNNDMIDISTFEILG